MNALDKMTNKEREELANDLNLAWCLLRHVAGGHGHAVDACLEAARIIRPKEDT